MSPIVHKTCFCCGLCLLPATFMCVLNPAGNMNIFVNAINPAFAEKGRGVSLDLRPRYDDKCCGDNCECGHKLVVHVVPIDANGGGPIVMEAPPTVADPI